jgi:ADP-ribosylglycohydrolase
MLGAIAGDVIGSVHEGSGTKTRDFLLFVEDSRFTDDTVLTVAVAERLLRGGSYVDLYHDYFHAYPLAGYGGSFIRWAGYRRRDPYNSWGNGSAMRVSPVGFACGTLEEVLVQARESAEVTHNHPEGVRGAQATAAAVFLARSGYTKADIKAHIEREFGYNLSERLDAIRERYSFDVSCQGSVPQSIIAFLEADGFEDAVRNAISLGGDADTMACIAGGIAEAFFGSVPDEIASRTLDALDERLRGVVNEFRERFADRRTSRCT